MSEIKLIGQFIISAAFIKLLARFPSLPASKSHFVIFLSRDSFSCTSPQAIYFGSVINVFLGSIYYVYGLILQDKKVEEKETKTIKLRKQKIWGEFVS